VNKETLVEQTLTVLRNRGQKSLEIAKQSLVKERVRYKTLKQALCYFAETVFRDIMHPGLLSIYCEAVGGDPDETTEVGSAIVLLVGAADVHDDIIDGSTSKNGVPTVFGKFGKDVAILTGDALLIEGMLLLNEATMELSENKRKAILELIKKAFFDLSSAEAEETLFRGITDLSGKEYFELIKRKMAVAEATAKIGAILGEGTAEDVKMLGEIGRNLGLLNTLRDEFIDVFEPDELGNRCAREILPLPILNVFQDPKKKAEILQLLKGRKITKAKTGKIVYILKEAKEKSAMKNKMRFLIKAGLCQASSLKGATQTLQLLLEASAEDLL